MKYISTILLSSLWFVGVAYADPVTLSWDAYPGPIAGFKVYQSVVPGVYGVPRATIASGEASSHTFDIAQNKLPTTYYFTITAFSASGVESAKSNEVSKVIDAFAIPAVTPNPGKAVLVLANITKTSVEVSWDPIDDGTGSPAKIDIRMSLAANPGWGSMATQICPSSPCLITGLLPGTAYIMQAVAWRPGQTKNIFGPLSTVLSFSTVPPDVDPIPTPPVGLKVTKAEPAQVIISASLNDCPYVVTSTKGSTSAMSMMTVSCAP